VSDLEQRILDAVAPLSGIETLVLFGSRATGRARPDSDLDVAVLPREDVESRRKLQLAVIVALMDLAPKGRVDVVLVDEAPVVLRQRIMEQGRVLIGADSRAWKRLRFETMQEYADTAYHRRLYREKQAERLLRGEGSGRSGIALETLRRTRRLLGKA
jgi:predicted nucleotidyltransferase